MKKNLLLTILISLILSGCAIPLPEPIAGSEPERIIVETPAAETQTSEISDKPPVEINTLYDTPIEALENPGNEFSEEDLAARERIGLTEDSIETLLTGQQGKYHFDRISPAEQRLYVELLTVMKEYSSDIIISSMDPENIEKVFQCVLNDHPEIFYVVGYRYTQYSLDDIPKKIAFTATYNIGLTEKRNRQMKIDAYVEKCFSGIPPGADEYEKVKYIYEYLINNTEYDAMAPDNQNICSVFLRGRSVCQGYAKATQYLLNLLNIPTTLIMGRVSGGEGHAWNIALIDGEYYHIDTTFGDASYQVDANSDNYGNLWNNTVWPINYDYLLVTTEQIRKTHIIEPIVPLVECTATANNYFIREGLFFEFVDEERLQALFNREYERGNHYITLKCANPQVYSEMMDFLIEKQNIFNYLINNDGVIRYADMEDQLSISFWL